MDSTLAQRTFNLRPTPFQEQIRATLEWVKNNPL
jgi:hypothetical protein